MDFDGRPVASESDFPFKEKLLGLMGIGVTDNGDVWIADGSDNQLQFDRSKHCIPGRSAISICFPGAFNDLHP